MNGLLNVVQTNHITASRSCRYTLMMSFLECPVNVADNEERSV